MFTYLAPPPKLEAIPQFSGISLQNGTAECAWQCGIIGFCGMIVSRDNDRRCVDVRNAIKAGFPHLS